MYHGGSSGLTLTTRTISRARNGHSATSCSASSALSDPSCPSTIGPRVELRAISTGHGAWSTTSAATDPRANDTSAPWLWLPTITSSASMTGGPEIDGLIVIPAVLTGLVLGLLADAFVRYIALEPA